MEDLTLVIMAAGMGSRFGGLKQIEPVGPNGEFIVDYSIYDAKRAGFNKVVFIIKEENYDLFRQTIGKRVEDKIKVEYAFQKMEDVPSGVAIPEGREKPWGTSHAVLCTKDFVKGNFAIINADDFYGKEAYEVVGDFFREKPENEYLIVGYKVDNTLSDVGSTKRGVCEVSEGYLEDLVESEIEKNEGIITARPLSGEAAFTIEADTPVSMNMFGFTDDIYGHLTTDFERFFEDNKEDLTKCEVLIPDHVGDMVKKNIKKVRVLPTVATWHGITYKDDKDKLMNEIEKLIQKGDYPRNLA
ncbi:MAG: sugar phosphate nucleotidyltransferase [Oscillospiraceae bacterium]|nr:sugar phosphate nucleotidyltransferase [Oscillospiraceae bacterium]